MDSQAYEDNLQQFPATKKANLDKETDVKKFDIFCKMHFYAEKLVHSESSSLAEFEYVYIIQWFSFLCPQCSTNDTEFALLPQHEKLCILRVMFLINRSY